MIIRRNTKAFKAIVDIVTACEARADREKLIRVHITKAGHTIKDRINVEGIQGDTEVFYDLNYAAVLTNLNSTGHQLHQSDEDPGIYFFHSSSNKTWDENPFEFDPRVAEEFVSLPDLPVTRKREKPVKVESLPRQKAVPHKKEVAGKNKKETRKQESIAKEDPAPKQPNYKLDKKIHFTDLDRIIVRQATLTKHDVLDYYHKMAEHILPYLKDRPEVIRIHTNRNTAKDYADAQALKQEAFVEIPDWLQTATQPTLKKDLLLCNNEEHLLFYIENGCLDFYPCHARAKAMNSPDYCLIAIESAEGEFDRVVDVARTMYAILTGVQLPSLVKTDGLAGLHIYIPLDAKSEFADSKHVAESICKLVRLKLPGQVALRDAEDTTYGKVLLDYQLNEPGKSVIAPYSLMPDTGIVSTPLSWNEVEKGLRPDQFTHEVIFKRIKKSGDLLEGLFKKKVHAAEVSAQLDKHYAFLF
jgi:DNA ligase D-like protein (predicted polymerase)